MMGNSNGEGDSRRSPLRGSGHSDEPASGLTADAGSVPNAVCGNCRHWTAPVDHWEGGFGTCAAVREKWEIRNAPFATKPRTDFKDWDEVEALEEQALQGAKACVVDGSGYHAALETRADFGCVLFAQAIETRQGQDRHGLGAKHESAVA